MSIRSILTSLVLASFLLPAAAAQEPVVECHLLADAEACVILDDNDRMSHHGGYVYDGSTGTFVAAGHSEGSGFFGYVSSYDVYAYSPVTGQYFVVILAFNDGHPSDGEYEYGALVVTTWNDLGPGVEVAGGYTDSDGDGKRDTGGLFYDAVVFLP